MQAESPIAQRWELTREHLDERQRRAFAATELGLGGVAQVVAATGMARNTIMAGMQELDGTSNEFVAAEPLARARATRRSGGGRQVAGQMLKTRSRAGLTQDAVAERMGTTKSAISRLESAGKHAPSLATLKRYASAVGCEPVANDA